MKCDPDFLLHVLYVTEYKFNYFLLMYCVFLHFSFVLLFCLLDMVCFMYFIFVIFFIYFVSFF